MRKQLNGLIDIIQYNFKLDSYSNTLFLFCGRWADRIKAVRYEANGICFLYKCFENDRLKWPKIGEEARQICLHPPSKLLNFEINSEILYKYWEIRRLNPVWVLIYRNLI